MYTKAHHSENVCLTIESPYIDGAEAAPEIVNLNDVVSETLMRMRQLVGEDIELIWTPCASLWTTKIDQAQLDHILVNLLLNVRDAIAGGGRVTLKTKNVTIDSDYRCNNYVEAALGEYVMLTVSDNGHGMEKAIQCRIFEPFYTTKDVGEGTGMGLAIVCGIVEQHNGYIYVHSEPDKGTTFQIYLPRVIAPSSRHTDVVPPVSRANASSDGGETILLVDDEEPVRKICERLLVDVGYTVISAASPAQALDIVGRKKTHINLLLSDVIMPEMNGQELARQILDIQPDMKVLFMSGYPVEIISHQELFAKDIAFLAKPFSRSDLIQKVLAVLNNGHMTL